ncbi:MAG: hypothetical protein LE178_02395 [Endomicrobium sp.]|nr:hypothetical protein [Endomicrobium sp.]
MNGIPGIDYEGAVSKQNLYDAGGNTIKNLGDILSQYLMYRQQQQDLEKQRQIAIQQVAQQRAYEQEKMQQKAQYDTEQLITKAIANRFGNGGFSVADNTGNPVNNLNMAQIRNAFRGIGDNSFVNQNTSQEELAKSQIKANDAKIKNYSEQDKKAKELVTLKGDKKIEEMKQSAVYKVLSDEYKEAQKAFATALGASKQAAANRVIRARQALVDIGIPVPAIDLPINNPVNNSVSMGNNVTANGIVWRKKN